MLFFAENAMVIEKSATIVDNESPTLIVTTTEFEVDEDVGSDGFEFEVKLSGATRQTVSFKFDLSNGSAIKDEDFTEVPESERTVIIPIGDTTKKIKIPIINDSDYEGKHSFTITLSNFSGAVLADGETRYSATIDIDDDEGPTLSIANTNLYVGEDVGDSGYGLELVLSGETSNEVVLDLAINGGNAVAGTDYDDPTQRIVFDEEQTEIRKIIPIGIIDNDMIDGNKTIQFTLSNISGAVFAGGGK